MKNGFHKDVKRDIGDFTKAIMWACVVIVYLVVSVALLYRFVGIWVLLPVPYFLYMLAVSVRFGEDMGRGLLGCIRLESNNKVIVVEYIKNKLCWMVRLETSIKDYEKKNGTHWEEQQVKDKPQARSWEKVNGTYIVERQEVVRVDFGDYELTINDVMLLLSVLLISHKQSVFNAEFLRSVLELIYQERGHVRFSLYKLMCWKFRRRSAQMAGLLEDSSSPPLSGIGQELEKYEKGLIEFENI